MGTMTSGMTGDDWRGHERGEVSEESAISRGYNIFTVIALTKEFDAFYFI